MLTTSSRIFSGFLGNDLVPIIFPSGYAGALTFPGWHGKRSIPVFSTLILKKQRGLS